MQKRVVILLFFCALCGVTVFFNEILYSNVIMLFSNEMGLGDDNSNAKYKIWVYTLTMNGKRLLPLFLMHYKFATKVIIYDFNSTDRTLEIAGMCKTCVVRRAPRIRSLERYMTFVATIRNQAWKEARHKADYVIVVDLDEFFTYNVTGGIQALLAIDRGNSTLFKTICYDMISFSETVNVGQPLTEQVRYGYRASHIYDKVLMFSPMLDEISYNGAHDVALAAEKLSCFRQSICSTCIRKWCLVKSLRVKITQSMQIFLQRVRVDFNQFAGFGWQYGNFERWIATIRDKKLEKVI
jgi:hypothetical protein